MPGKSGTIAAQFVAKTLLNEKTFLIATPTSNTIAQALAQQNKEKLPYDPIRSFSIISCFAQAPYIFVVEPNGPKTMKEFINLAKQKNGSWKYSSTGIGGPHHLIAEYLFSEIGIHLQHIPAAGGAKALELVQSKEAAAMMPASILALPQIQSGLLKALAITGDSPLTLLPGIPTLNEVGIPIELQSWYGLMAPKGMPVEQMNQLANVIQTIFQKPENKKKIESLGINLIDMRSNEFIKMMEEETRIWEKVANRVMK